MIEELRISSLGVIDSSTLELGPGLTVITGETGAGKTMVVTALGLLLGGRADSGAVRTGARQARVEGVVSARDLPGFEGSMQQMERRYAPAMDRQLQEYWLRQYVARGRNSAGYPIASYTRC